MRADGLQLLLRPTEPAIRRQLTAVALLNSLIYDLTDHSAYYYFK